jgi:hypothetical protein
MTTQRPVYVLRLRPLPGINGLLALRHALKRLLRDHGLAYLEVREEEPAPALERDEARLEIVERGEDVLARIVPAEPGHRDLRAELLDGVALP